MFQGYLRAIGDFSHVRLTVPCVMSIDGYMAWNGTYKLELMNTEGKIITNIESIIEP